MDNLRCGLGEGLWIDLPKEQRDKVKKSTGDTVAPCGIVGFRKEIQTCRLAVYEPMCKVCRSAK